MVFCYMLVFTLLSVYPGQFLSELVLEEGYTVSTVLDGNKLHINPSSVVPRPGSHDLLILDSSASVFYAVSFPISRDSEINWFAGTGKHGFSDGVLKSATFNHPESFTVDTRGNVYVADRRNYAIRKISKSGVTTIAGGYSKRPGNMDGPAQNASLSHDFDLAFLPERCMLLISDYGNSLVRQINLKPEDCAKDSHIDGWQHLPHGLGLGLAWVCILRGLEVLGLFALISCIEPHVQKVLGCSFISRIWKQYQHVMGRQILLIGSVIGSIVASSRLTLLFLRLVKLFQSRLSQIFSAHRVEQHSVSKEPVNLLDSDGVNNHKLTHSENQLKDLIILDGGMGASQKVEGFKQVDDEHKGTGVLTGSHGKVDAMRWANIMDFPNQCEGGNPVGCTANSASGLIKRK